MRRLLLLLCPLFIGCADWGYIHPDVDRNAPPRTDPVVGAEIASLRYAHGHPRHRCGYGCHDYAHVIDVRGTGFRVYTGEAQRNLDLGPYWRLQLGMGSGSGGFSYSHGYALQGGQSHGHYHHGSRHQGNLYGYNTVHWIGPHGWIYSPYTSGVAPRDGNTLGSGRPHDGSPTFTGDWSGSSSSGSSGTSNRDLRYAPGNR